MGVIRPRPPASQNLAADRAANLADRQQMRRLITSQRPPRPAVGGVTGVTRCTAGAISQSNGSSSTLFFTDWSIASLPGSTDAPSVTDAGGGSLAVDDGWLMFATYVQLSWNVSGGPPEFQFQASWTDAPDPTPDWKVVLSSADLLGGGGPSLRDVFSWGPVHHAAGDEVFLGGSWSTSGAAFLSGVAVDVWRVG